MATTSTAVQVTRSCIAENAHRDEVVLEYLHLVKSVAQRMRATLPVQAELNDLIQTGTLGLIDAADKYDPTRGVLFQTYAKHRIRGAILDGLRQLDWASRSLRRRQNLIEATARELTAELLREPTEAEVAEKAGLTLTELREITLAVSNFRLANACGRAEEESDTRQFEPPTQPETHPDWICANQRLSDTVREAIRSLPDRSRRMILLYYEHDMTMREIGNLFGINESRVSQVHKSALGKIAKALEDKGIHSSEVM